MPAQRSVVRDDGMRTQQAHAAHAAKRPQSSVPGGQEVRVSDDLAMGSTDESNNETKLTNSEAAGNQGKANIDTGNGMQLKTFTPGVEDVDGMPASKGEGGHSYVQIEGDSTALGGGHQGVEAEDKPEPGLEGEENRTDVQEDETGAGPVDTTYKEPGADLEAHPGNKATSLFSKAEKGVENIMSNLNVLAKGAANQQVHLKSHREAIVQLKDKFYELKNAILVKMGILKDRLKKMQDGMGKAQEYEGADFKLSVQLQKLQLQEEHKPLKATVNDAAALVKAKKAAPEGDLESLQNTDIPGNVPYLEGAVGAGELPPGASGASTATQEPNTVEEDTVEGSGVENGEEDDRVDGGENADE